ncbi:glycosyltransferase family 4 protein [Micromonospora eburnea]|uniref:D-inositol-3-phosphate glycosyltransferase n=1 Tax=Micromonospora eburnea TaxID=227316 RepID=A0A1C6U416_9ACTN|nr:glycosyltransferase [Micromonospora eburnea]SCL48777.1 D-inositol-3-phosphate glycosyltransferase [Micromonospora eburnea]
MIRPAAAPAAIGGLAQAQRDADRTRQTGLPQRRRKVALVTHGFEQGGGVRTIARWLRGALAETGGYQVDVHDLAVWSRDPSSRRLIRPATWLRGSLREPLHASPGWHWGANAVEVEWMRYRPRRELSRLLRRYDLVQVVCGAPAWAGVVTGLGVPVVLQVATLASWERAALFAQAGDVQGYWRRLMTAGVSALERRALRQVDAVLVENATMAALARSSGQPRVVLAPPGIDTDRFKPASTGWRADGYLLSLCRLADPRKGLDRLLAAYAMMVRADPGTPALMLAGKGRLPDDLMSLINSLGLVDRVLLRPDVASADLVDLYQGASVFMQASHEEGLGLSVIEAMACGLPVVSTASAGACESVVDGSTGWLVPLEPAGDVPAVLGARARAVLNGPGGDFGRRGRDRVVERFSTRIALQGIVAVYDEILSPSGGDGAVPCPSLAGSGE